jgi:hypothetical protein
MLRETEWRLHDRTDLVRKKPGGFVEALQLLTISFGQLGLKVPGIDMAGAAIHEEPDDILGPGGKMGRPGGHGISLGVCSLGQHVLLKETSQSEHAYAIACAAQKITP